MRWSVGIEAAGDRVLTREQVVELADAVSASGGIASGIGSSRYGAQLIVDSATTPQLRMLSSKTAYTTIIARGGTLTLRGSKERTSPHYGP